jgi:hypothetical protein
MTNVRVGMRQLSSHTTLMPAPRVSFCGEALKSIAAREVMWLIAHTGDLGLMLHT